MKIRIFLPPIVNKGLSIINISRDHINDINTNELISILKIDESQEKQQTLLLYMVQILMYRYLQLFDCFLCNLAF